VFIVQERDTRDSYNWYNNSGYRSEEAAQQRIDKLKEPYQNGREFQIVELSIYGDER